jgi:phosphoribosylformimino-5-aminoimidazole carboxamide ribotide isomerase
MSPYRSRCSSLITGDSLGCSQGVPLRLLIEGLEGHIETIRPDYGRRLWIDTNLGKVNRVTKEDKPLQSAGVVIIPAIDLLGGRVVRLHQGDFSEEKSYATDPLPLVREYATAGARRLHIVDLDRARGSGDNRALVEHIVAEASVEVQVAGGIRKQTDVDFWLEVGATAVVMGTTAVRQPELLAEVAARRPGQVLAALDVKEGQPAVAGWSEVERKGIDEVLSPWTSMPLAGVILTSIDRDGTLAGPDLPILAQVRATTRQPLIYSGGVATLEDLGLITSTGADGVILGKSLLEGCFTLAEALGSPWLL